MLAEIRTYADFPKSEEWLRKTLAGILKAKPVTAGRV